LKRTPPPHAAGVVVGGAVGIVLVVDEVALLVELLVELVELVAVVVGVDVGVVQPTHGRLQERVQYSCVCTPAHTRRAVSAVVGWLGVHVHVWWWWWWCVGGVCECV